MSHISLPALSDELRVEAEASAAGMAGHPVRAHGTLRQVAIRLRSGGALPEHDNPGEATLLVVEGAVRFLNVESGAVHELRAGDLLEVPTARHRVEAEEESLLLLSFVSRAA